MVLSQWQIRLGSVMGASLLVAAAGWYSPLLSTAGWHVFHPRGWVNYRGLHVRVPWPWTADIDSVNSDPTLTPQGLSLKKNAYTLGRNVAADMIFVTVVSADPGVSASQQTEAWMTSFRATHPGSIFDSRSSVAAPAGATCLSARNHWSRPSVIWTCISVDAGWEADYEGWDGDEPVFFGIVRDLRK
jgi:hypothetical protein